MTRSWQAHRMQTRFRAWDRRRKEMFKVFCYEQDSSRVSIDGDEFLSVPREAALMQFTGLCDRNGVEIYEGDIGKSTGSAGAHVVEDLRDMAWWEAETSEIVGNIYENPEFLPS
jgi:YopX protein